ncbi:Penicillin acylase II [hydrothermal vent metagenome]|uniref:Penicillin acylase II n=1 Tax=hydrothermal vent metagenome TaxID=652676 RepID=A0A3B0RMQ7_9ZZZZ
MSIKTTVMKTVKWVSGMAGLVIVVGILVAYMTFRASLPTLDGRIITSEVQEDILVERDKNGNATLTAGNRLDLAYATGFVHAQERFFQIDLSRRMAAGELSELFGPLALKMDQKNRLHRFRARAKTAISELSDNNRALLKKYVAGINDGLKELDSKPFEYWLLQQEPRPWTEEDSFLVIYSMFFALQSGTINTEWQRYYLEDSLDPRLVKFLLPHKTEWDAPLQPDAEPWTPQEIPSAEVLKNHPTELAMITGEEAEVPGSNNWAVSGKITKNGAAILSNDMHLGIRAPATWFRLRLKLSDNSLDISGVSLPGTPLIIVGSNGSVAWGYTNSFVDTSDMVDLKINPDFDQQYMTPEGYKDFVVYDEEIKVKDAAPVTLKVRETIWGPVTEADNGKPFALKWVAHQPQAVNMGLIRMETVKTVADAMRLAPGNGIPAQNAMLADVEGNIGWIHFGALPKRKPGNYERAGDWSDGKLGWTGWLNFDERPKVFNPANNRLWTANSRVVSGADYATVGDGGADIGARQKQIRDDLMRLGTGLVEKDLYAIQLDNRAVFWDRWQQQLLLVLNSSNDDRLQPFITAVKNWGGRAAKSSVGFRLVENYRKSVYRGLTTFLTGPCTTKFKSCNYNIATHQMDSPFWRLADQRPTGWLPAEFNDDWQAFFEQRSLAAWAPVIKGEVALADYTWGAENRSLIRHPLSKSVPLLSYLTDMRPAMQDGARGKMPHIAGNSFGQSERIVVSPGHEQDGIMNMPAGQSGHPLSPYYGAGHEDWLSGKMTPFLPGYAKWTLQIAPER